MAIDHHLGFKARDDKDIENKIKNYFKWEDEEQSVVQEHIDKSHDAMYDFLKGEKGLRAIKAKDGKKIDIHKAKFDDHVDDVYRSIADSIIDGHLSTYHDTKNDKKGQELHKRRTEELKKERDKSGREYFTKTVNFFGNHYIGDEQAKKLVGTLKRLEGKGESIGKILNNMRSLTVMNAQGQANVYANNKIDSDLHGYSNIDLLEHAEDKYLKPVGGKVEDRELWHRNGKFGAMQSYRGLVKGDIGDVEWNKLGLKIDPKAAQKHHEDNYKKK